MPIIKSAFKDLRKSKKHALFNRKVKTGVKMLIKKSRQAIAKNDAVAKDLVLQAIKAIDKAAQKGILKKNTTARKKSRLMKRLNALGK